MPDGPDAQVISNRAIDGICVDMHYHVIEGDACMRTITDITAATGCGIRDLDNFLSRQEMSTVYPAQRAGRRRLYTLDNAVEIGLCEAFRRAGLKPSAAVAYTRNLLQMRQNARRGIGPEMPNYVVFRDGDLTKASSAHDLASEEIKAWLTKASSVAIVSTRDVIGRVEAHFDVYGVEATE